MSPNDINKLLMEARTYREFIGSYLEFSKAQKGKMSYRSLALKAGFSSKSYLRDVCIGDKRLTLRSLPMLMKALRMNEDQRKYFTLLVAREEKEVNVSGLTKAEIKERLQKIANRMKSKVAGHDIDVSAQIYGRQHWVEVFASLGPVDEGSSLEEIASRSLIDERYLPLILDEMAKAKIVSFDPSSRHYFPANGHLIFNSLGGESFFKERFLRSLQRVQKSAAASFKEDDRLFLDSTISVRKERLPLFKQELRELLLRFLDSTEDPHGNGLAKLVVGFLPNAALDTRQIQTIKS